MFSKVCMVKDHEQKPIEFVCVYPECNQSRFLCSKCLKVKSHGHQQFYQDYIVDPKEIIEYIRRKIIEKDQAINEKENNQLKQIMQEIQSQIKNMLNFIQRLEQGIEQFLNGECFDSSLSKLKTTGFSQLDDDDLNNLIKIDQRVGGIYKQLSEQSNPIIQNLIRIQEYCHSQMKDDSGLLQKIKDAKCQLINQDQLEGDFEIWLSAISNDLKYVASGGNDKILKIWNYESNTLIKSIQFQYNILSIKFTEDSKFLYVGQHQYLHQFDLCNQFRETYKQAIHSEFILNIFCISNTIILTSSTDKTIIKTDISLKQQLLIIKAHDNTIYGTDYNVNLNMIASSSYDKSIKLWSGDNGELIIDKQNAHTKYYSQEKQINLISLDCLCSIIIWNMNFEKKQLDQIQNITDTNGIFNISLVLDQQYITLICKEYIKIYSIIGDYLRSINHDVNELNMFRTIQQQSMKAIIVVGKKTLQICQLNLD